MLILTPAKRRRMAHFWFVKSEDPTSDDQACFCDFCTDSSGEGRADVAPYWKKGLKLKHGTVITLAIAKECTKMMAARLAEIHQPDSLEDLCGRVVSKNVNMDQCNKLPLPDLMLDNIRDGLYDVNKAGNFAYDHEFTDRAKMMPGVLCCIETNRRH